MSNREALAFMLFAIGGVCALGSIGTLMLNNHFGWWWLVGGGVLFLVGRLIGR